MCECRLLDKWNNDVRSGTSGEYDSENAKVQSAPETRKNVV